MSDAARELELRLLDAEAEEAAARARVEVYRRALGTKAPDAPTRARRPKRELPAREVSETDEARALKLARDMGIPVLAPAGGRK